MRTQPRRVCTVVHDAPQNCAHGAVDTVLTPRRRSQERRLPTALLDAPAPQARYMLAACRRVCWCTHEDAANELREGRSAKVGAPPRALHPSSGRAALRTRRICTCHNVFDQCLVPGAFLACSDTNCVDNAACTDHPHTRIDVTESKAAEMTHKHPQHHHTISLRRSRRCAGRPTPSCRHTSPGFGTHDAVPAHRRASRVAPSTCFRRVHRTPTAHVPHAQVRRVGPAHCTTQTISSRRPLAARLALRHRAQRPQNYDTALPRTGAHMRTDDPSRQNGRLEGRFHCLDDNITNDRVAAAPHVQRPHNLAHARPCTCRVIRRRVQLRTTSSIFGLFAVRSWAWRRQAGLDLVALSAVAPPTKTGRALPFAWYEVNALREDGFFRDVLFRITRSVSSVAWISHRPRTGMGPRSG